MKHQHNRGPGEQTIGTIGGWRANSRLTELAVLTITVVAAGALLLRLDNAPPPEVEMSGFATSLAERTASQQHNAVLSAAAINGSIIQPGGEFSFNRAVKSWSRDRGYVKAPVSYDGDLIKAFGGGVCQTSTTLYNAALLAGLPILERHPHAFAPHYVPPGRDAAVAQYDVDLRFKNPFSWPIRIIAETDDRRLSVRILGAKSADMKVALEADRMATIVPRRLTRVFSDTSSIGKRPYLRNPGATGYRVITYRVFSKSGKEIRRERLGDDSYQAMNRVVQVREE